MFLEAGGAYELRFRCRLDNGLKLDEKVITPAKTPRNWNKTIAQMWENEKIPFQREKKMDSNARIVEAKFIPRQVQRGQKGENGFD